MDEHKEAKPKRLPRMDRNSPQWERKANELARCFAPSIHACVDCGGPVINGYCCERCGSTNPRG